MAAAYDLVTKARKTLPEDPELAAFLGHLSYQRKEYARAVQLLQESSRKKPLTARSLLPGNVLSSRHDKRSRLARPSIKRYWPASKSRKLLKPNAPSPICKRGDLPLPGAHREGAGIRRRRSKAAQNRPDKASDCQTHRDSDHTALILRYLRSGALNHVPFQCRKSLRFSKRILIVAKNLQLQHSRYKQLMNQSRFMAPCLLVEWKEV